MGIPHEERPEQKAKETSLHPDPDAVARAVKREVERPENEGAAGEHFDDADVDQEAECDDEDGGSADGEQVAKSDREERDQHDGAAPAMEAQGDGKEPSHRGIESVIEAERDQQQPRPALGHSLSSIARGRLTDSNRNPMRRRRLGGAPGAAAGPRAIRGRSRGRTPCRLPAWHRASPSTPSIPRDRIACRWHRKANW